jgi:hypothetical protein
MRQSIVLLVASLLTITTACMGKEDPVKTAECAPETTMDACDTCCGGPFSFVSVYGKTKCSCLTSSKPRRTVSN